MRETRIAAKVAAAITVIMTIAALVKLVTPSLTVMAVTIAALALVTTFVIEYFHLT